MSLLNAKAEVQLSYSLPDFKHNIVPRSAGSVRLMLCQPVPDASVAPMEGRGLPSLSRDLVQVLPIYKSPSGPWQPCRAASGFVTIETPSHKGIKRYRLCFLLQYTYFRFRRSSQVERESGGMLLWRLGCRGPAVGLMRGFRPVPPRSLPVREFRNHNPYTRGQERDWRSRNKTVLTYVAAAVVGMVGMSYAAVPLYRLYCQATGLGGTAVAGHSSEQIEAMEPVKDRVIKVTFNADVHASLHWNFRPQQGEIYVVPGETALAFYRAKNSTENPVIGISTYNVVPYEAGQYFNKIQCFCFEEQRLNPHEEVDMPVFFFIDPEFADDPRMAKVDTITLSYTFFEAKEGQKLPLPGYS